MPAYKVTFHLLKAWSVSGYVEAVSEAAAGATAARELHELYPMLKTIGRPQIEETR